MAIANTLSSLYLFDKTSMRATGKEITYKHERSEIEFIIKLVSVLIQNTFSSSPQISIDWDITSFTLTQRPDIIIICFKGVEIGCGEAKLPKKSKELIDIDRARVAEICKRQLHIRIQKSVSMKEWTTFGLLVGGMVMELTMLDFDNGQYNYSKLKALEIPERGRVYNSIEGLLEAIYGFKNMIESTVVSEDEEADEEIDLDEIQDLLKPTIPFME